MARTLANPVVKINNTVVGIVPNSLSYKAGRGDITLRPQSAGGNSIEVVKTENAETKKSMCKFMTYNTKGNIELKEEWQDSLDGNTIELSDGDFVVSFRKMFVIEDPEVKLSADGEVPLNFEGQPIV